MDLSSSGGFEQSYAGQANDALKDLQTTFSDLEKIATTNPPEAYYNLLRVVLEIYLLFLPFQLYNLLGWLTIPATAVTTITFPGFAELATQIEMPFGYYRSNLDLEFVVLNLTQQLSELTVVSAAYADLHVLTKML